MNLSLVTLLYLPLTYYFLLQIYVKQPQGYYFPLPFHAIALYPLLFAGFVMMIVFDTIGKKQQSYYWPRFIAIIATVVVFLGTVFTYQIYARHASNHFELIHDGAQQTEVAGDMILQGKNPYQENYRETKFGEINNYTDVPGQDNPAWYHYIYLPFFLLSSTALQLVSQALIGWYDLRFLLIIVGALTLLLLYKIIPERKDKLPIVLLFAFNPIFTPYFIAGYNDIFPYFWLLLSWYFLGQKKLAWSALALGLAVVSKQSAWLVVPFYIYHVLLQFSPTAESLAKRLWTTIKKIWPVYLAILVFAVPFIVWSPRDFFADTIAYAGGSSEHLFPVYGVGFSVIMESFGWIRSIWDPYPFWLIQTVVIIPVLAVLFRWQKKNPTIAQLIVNYTILLLAYWYFSRFFNPNYVSFLSLLLIAAWAFKKQEQQIKAQ